MSSSDPCKCEEQKPGYGGMCKTCGKECFRQEEEEPVSIRRNWLDGKGF